MEELSKDITPEFKTLESDEIKSNSNLLIMVDEQDKLKSLYIKVIDKIKENNAIIESLDVDIARLKEVKYKIEHYEQFKAMKKKQRIFQIAIVVGICSLLTLPLIGINVIAYLELILLSTAFISLSNFVAYFDDISVRKELVKSTDMNKLINNIYKKERQREIADCIQIKLNIRREKIANAIEDLAKGKDYMCSQLEHLDKYKDQSIEKLSKEFQEPIIEATAEFDQDNLLKSGPRLQLK